MQPFTHGSGIGRWLRRAAAPLLLAVALGAAQAGEYPTWDHFLYKLQLPVPVVAPEGSVTLSLYHTYPRPLHDLRIHAHGEGLTAVVRPDHLESLPPTEIKDVVLELRRDESLPAGADQAALVVEFQANELRDTRAVTLSIPLTEGGAQAVEQSIVIPAGAVDVTVNVWGDSVYYLYLVPVFGMLGWLLWRRKRAG